MLYFFSPTLRLRDVSDVCCMTIQHTSAEAIPLARPGALVRCIKVEAHEGQRGRGQGGGGLGSERQKGNIYRKIWKFKAPKRSKHAG